jgi:hypothetical protein
MTTKFSIYCSRSDPESTTTKTNIFYGLHPLFSFCHAEVRPRNFNEREVRPGRYSVFGLTTVPVFCSILETFSSTSLLAQTRHIHPSALKISFFHADVWAARIRPHANARPTGEKKWKKKHCNILLTVVNCINPILVMNFDLPGHKTEK